jgi:AspT/YidE/YbjL antiporter-like protein
LHYLDPLVDLFLANPLLLLFVVIGLGYRLGEVRIGSFRLGVAAILFVGLALGALHPQLGLPEIVYQLGLILFVYGVGLSSGSAFFTALRRHGLRDVSLGVALLALACLLSAWVGRLLHLPRTLVAGLFAGSLTNTPALAAVIEALKSSGEPFAERLLAEPVVGYSLTYPFGVIGIILAIHMFSVIWRVDFAQEAREHTASLADAESKEPQKLEVEGLNLLTMPLGISLGLLLGLVPIPLPGGLSFRLGFVGGPLIAALILGRAGRTGRLVWSMPDGVSHTVRQLGIVLFLAGIGTRSGYDFASTFKELGPLVLLGGAAVTFIYGSLTLFIYHKVLKVPMALAIGTLSGLQTQPAALVYSNERSQSELPNLSYAIAYPVGMITKIVLAQILFKMYPL